MLLCAALFLLLCYVVVKVPFTTAFFCYFVAPTTYSVIYHLFRILPLGATTTVTLYAPIHFRRFPLSGFNVRVSSCTYSVLRRNLYCLLNRLQSFLLINTFKFVLLRRMELMLLSSQCGRSVGGVGHIMSIQSHSVWHMHCCLTKTKL